MTGPSMQTSRRVALFMPYGYLPISTSVINAAKTWEAHGFGVDVYVPPSEQFGVPAFGARDIVVHRVRDLRNAGLPQLSFAYAAVRAADRADYAYAVGFDQGGLIAAAGLAVRKRCPFVYHSLELTLREQAHGARGRLVKAIETRCARHARIVVTQDEERAALLVGDLRLPANRIMIVPNTPLGTYSGERSDYLRSKFGLAPRSRVVLLSGSLIPEHLALEVIESVGDWPAGFVLAVHGWAPQPEYMASVLKAAARWPERVYVSFDVLPVELVDDLYSSADIGLAVYRPIDRNFVYIGAAAGKVFGFMRVGTPTIASDLPGMREIVVATGSGAVVRDVAEIPERLLQIVRSFDDFSRASRAAFLRYEFSRHYDRVVARLEDQPRLSL